MRARALELLWPGMRRRSARPVVARQRWGPALLLHWEHAPEPLRRRIPPALDLDLFDGRAYVSLVLSAVRGTRLRALPRLPALTDFDELACRTYVRRSGGMPGIWFFSLDASGGPPAALARALLGLPCRRARIEKDVAGAIRHFACARLHAGRCSATLDARWTIGPPLPPPAPGALDHFLTERHAIYTSGARGRLLRLQSAHSPWPLRGATLHALHETITAAAGLAVAGPPLARYSDGVTAELLLPELV